MADLSLTNDTRSAVLRFYAEDWTSDCDDHSEILQELPDDVAASCIWDLVHYDLKQVPLFQSLRLPASPWFLDDTPDEDEGAKVCVLVQCVCVQCFMSPFLVPCLYTACCWNVLCCCTPHRTVMMDFSCEESMCVL